MEHFIDLTGLFAGETDAISYGFVIDISGVNDDIKSGTATVKADASSHAGSVDLKLTITMDYKAECSRCLKELSLTSVYEKVLPVCMELIDSDNDEYLITENGMIDIAAAAVDVIVLESPSKLLCSPDCKGLCVKCGADLNKGKCGCTAKDIDPRLLKLKELL